MAEGARLESVYTATYRGFESPPHRHILRRARTKVRAFFSHFSCLYGSELCVVINLTGMNFLSCLLSSELKYYTFSPLLIKQNHLIFLPQPFFILTFKQH